MIQNREQDSQRKSFVKTSQFSMFATGLAFGALTAYLLDPARGKWRRAVIRDKLLSLEIRTGRKGSRWGRDFKNRMQGVVSEISRPMSPHIDDTTLESRVRSEFGRIVRNAKAVRTDVANGVVTLTGAILAEEVSKLIKTIKKIPGVQDVVNQLDVYESSIGVSELQGSGPEYLQ